MQMPLSWFAELPTVTILGPECYMVNILVILNGVNGVNNKAWEIPGEWYSVTVAYHDSSVKII